MRIVKLKALLKEAEKLTDEIGNLRIQVVEEKAKDELHEADLWINTPFKEKGLTNDKMRNAYVTQQMSLLYPSFYLTKKAKLTYLEERLKWVYTMIHTMRENGIDEIEFESDKDENEESKEAAKDSK